MEPNHYSEPFGKSGSLYTSRKKTDCTRRWLDQQKQSDRLGKGVRQDEHKPLTLNKRKSLTAAVRNGERTS